MSIVGIRDFSSSKKDPGAPYKTKPIPQSHSPLQIPLLVTRLRLGIPEARVAGVARTRERHSPKNLDSDKNFKPYLVKTR